MRRRTRGIAGMIVLSLGLGTVTTYGVAWWFANDRVAGQTYQIMLWSGSKRAEAWNVEVSRRRGVCDVISTSLNGDGVGLAGDPPPRWSLSRRVTPDRIFGEGMSGSQMIGERGSGWPLIAVVERVQDPLSGGVPLAFGDVSWRGLKSVGPFGWPITLPLLPVWPGFVVDAALYGVAWLALLVGFSGARRRIRRSAGTCGHCRYDLRGCKDGVCPECGSAVKGA